MILKAIKKVFCGKNITLSKIFGIAFVGLFLTGLTLDAFAGSTSGGNIVMLSKIQSNVATSVSETAKILQDLSLIAGIGFIMASFFKFHQHKLNPTQVPMSQGVTLLAIGGGLTLFPLLIPTAGSTILGASANVSKVSGSGINSLIGGSSSG